MMLVRIQLKRTKGWRMPPDTMKVDRSTRWGNPYVVGKTYPMVAGGIDGETFGNYTIQSASDAVDAFRDWAHDPLCPLPDVADLRGKNLACWCKLGSPCHADVLLELANPVTAP